MPEYLTNVKITPPFQNPPVEVKNNFPKALKKLGPFKTPLEGKVK